MTDCPLPGGMPSDQLAALSQLPPVFGIQELTCAKADAPPNAINRPAKHSAGSIPSFPHLGIRIMIAPSLQRPYFPTDVPCATGSSMPQMEGHFRPLRAVKAFVKPASESRRPGCQDLWHPDLELECVPVLGAAT